MLLQSKKRGVAVKGKGVQMPMYWGYRYAF